MRRFFQIYTIASLCVCAASVSAQEKTPVALTSDEEELAKYEQEWTDFNSVRAVAKEYVGRWLS